MVEHSGAVTSSSSDSNSDRNPTSSPVASLAASALQAIPTLLPVHVHVADVRGALQQVPGHDARTGAGTLRELWERQQPSRPGQNERMPFLETPAMRALGGHTVHRETLHAVRGDARARVLVSATPLRDDAGTVTGVVVVEETVVDAADETQEERLAIVRTLASKLMHDVNNAFNPIMASAFLLNHHAESPGSVREYAERIRLAVESGTGLSARVARFVRQDPVHEGGDAPLDLAALVDEVLAATVPGLDAASPDRGGCTVVREPGAPLHTRGLPEELRVAVGNIVQNALEAMPAGGTLSVRTYRDGPDACVDVRDTGTGIQEDVRGRVFDPFFTTRGAGRVGLGLSEVYGIMRRHRGTVTVAPHAPSGTVVTLRLPIAQGSGMAESSAAPGVETGPLRVLVVEDHDDGRDLLVRLLRSAGHTVETAQTCAEAKILLADELALPYHLLLTDVGLPDGSGWELVSYARGRYSSLRIGVITGWALDADEVDTRGAEFVLRKPLRATELLAHVAGGVRSTTT
ncbi:MAG: ATP-binding protein [Gemmatimonadota bacterium]